VLKVWALCVFITGTVRALYGHCMGTVRALSRDREAVRREPRYHNVLQNTSLYYNISSGASRMCRQVATASAEGLPNWAGPLTGSWNEIRRLHLPRTPPNSKLGY
jgi:hypothetical protein